MGCSSSTPIEQNPLICHKESGHDHFQEGITTLSNGSKRNITSWIPKDTKVKALVFFSHGLLEHSLKYDTIAHKLTADGYACYGIDAVGHGLSTDLEKQKGLIPDYRILYSDFIAFVKSIQSKPEYSQLPSFILSHSMGTLVAMLSLLELAPTVTAVLFSGCPFSVGFASASPFGLRALYPIGKSSIAPGLARVLAAVDPHGPAAPLMVDYMSTDPNELEIRKRDGRTYHGDVQNKTAYEYLKLSREAKKIIGSIKTPCKIIHGSDDQVVLPTGSQYLHDNIGTSPDQKSLAFISGARHEILNEVETIASQASADIVDYFNSFLVSSPDGLDVVQTDHHEDRIVEPVTNVIIE